MTTAHPFLDVPAFPADAYAPLADRLKALLGTRNDVIFVQAEAILALEAAATSLGLPGMVALNIVTSPYGGYFGDWLRRAGATVHEVVAEPGRPVAASAVRATLDRLPQVDLVAVVHAETSSGILNPLADIAAAAHAKNALLVVDAVASIGGHAVEVDAIGIDLCVIGPQKALGGPAGLSVVSVSARAWDAMGRGASKPTTPSSLSLLDIKANWLEQGRGAVPGMPSALEFWALRAALDRVEQEGLGALIARHGLAAKASRAGLVGLGLVPWVGDEAEASTLVTAAPVPAGISPDTLLAAARSLGAAVSPGFGAVRDRLVRLDHTGPRANAAAVLANTVGYGEALRGLGVAVDIGSAVDAVARAMKAE